MTFSNRELQKRIDYLNSMLAKVQPTSWTAGKLRHDLAYLERQLALPQAQRNQWQHGTI